MQELSQWFNLSEQKPWEPGVYEIKETSSGKSYFSYWCGNSFHGGWLFAERAYEFKTHYGDGRQNYWRGLSSDPSKTSPKPRGNRRVTRYVVAETVGLFSSHINPDAIHGVFEDSKIAEGVAKKLRDNFHPTARVFKTKRFRTPEASQA